MLPIFKQLDKFIVDKQVVFCVAKTAYFRVTHMLGANIDTHIYLKVISDFKI